MSDELPDYTGTFCRMCAFPAAKYRFCASDCKDDGTGEIDTGAPAMNRSATMHLHRTCERCGFEWLEKTMDQTSLDLHAASELYGPAALGD